MRLIVLASIAAMLGGCMIPVHPADTSSQSELDRQAREGCTNSPNTDELLACRRRTQDSWRNPPASPSNPRGLPGAPA